MCNQKRKDGDDLEQDTLPRGVSYCIGLLLCIAYLVYLIGEREEEGEGIKALRVNL